MTRRRLLFTLLLAASAATMSANGGTPSPDNKGTDFVLAFPQNTSLPATPPVMASHRLTLFIAAEDTTTIEISGPEVATTTLDLGAGSVVEAVFCKRLSPTGCAEFDISPQATVVNTVGSEGIRVRSIDALGNEGAPIAVYGLNRRLGSAGAYVALPADVLGTRYRTIQRPGTLAGPGSQVTVVATEDKTTVQITTQVNVPPVAVAGVPFEITLNYLQTFLLQLPEGDLTSTLVTADKPIAVFSGNQNSLVTGPVPPPGPTPDHLIEQMVPVPSWGHEFIVAPIATIAPTTTGDIVRVIADEADTSVLLNGELKKVLGPGEFYEFVQSTITGSWISTSKPSLVAHYNQAELLQKSPFVMLVPPVNGYSRHYRFRTPRFSVPGENHHVTIVVKDGDEAGLMLNGVTLPAGTVWTSVNGYRYSRVMIPAGTAHLLEHSEPSVRFGAWVYGHAPSEGYGYAAGQLVEDKTPPEFLSRPLDQTVEATGPDGAAVTWDDPVATDFGRGELDLVCGPSSGSVFPLGTTIVTCRAIDPAGNETTASFNVTVGDTTPPTLIVPENIALRPTSRQGAIVTFEATATDLVDPDVSVVCLPRSGSVFAPGTDTVVRCTATDMSGNASDGEFTVSVINGVPICSAAVPSVRLLWPPNHDLVPITIKGVTDPDGDRVSIQIDSVFQDEPTSGTGDGNTSLDGFGIGHIAMVRAERSARGNGRVYHIGFTATDAFGASCRGTVTVGVPRTPNFPPVDDGAIYDSSAQLPDWVGALLHRLTPRLLSMR